MVTDSIKCFGTATEFVYMLRRISDSIRPFSHKTLQCECYTHAPKWSNRNNEYTAYSVLIGHLLNMSHGCLKSWKSQKQRHFFIYFLLKTKNLEIYVILYLKSVL